MLLARALAAQGVTGVNGSFKALLDSKYKPRTATYQCFEELYVSKVNSKFAR